MTTHIGREYEVMSAIEKLGLNLIKSDELVEYTDTSNVTLFTLPANVLIVALICEVTTAFTAGATLEVDDGTTEGLYGRLENALYTVQSGTTSLGRFVFWPMFEQTSASSIVANVTANGATLAAGVTKWWLVFRPMSTDREPNLK